MILYPAMDLMGGRVVRLRQGRFDEATDYSVDPAEALRGFADAGARWAHIVDLDGARTGAPVQHELIGKLARSAPVKVQVGGGLRTRDQLLRMFDAGVRRVVVGSLAVREPDLLREWLDEFGPERIALAFDVRCDGRTPVVAVAGWTEDSRATLWESAALFPQARHLLLTDIGRDGMLTGPNFDLLNEAVERLPQFKIQASGGVSSLADLRQLRTDGAIIGKALWEGRIRLEEGLALAGA